MVAEREQHCQCLLAPGVQALSAVRQQLRQRPHQLVHHALLGHLSHRRATLLRPRLSIYSIKKQNSSIVGPAESASLFSAEAHIAKHGTLSFKHGSRVEMRMSGCSWTEEGPPLTWRSHEARASGGPAATLRRREDEK